MGDFNFPGIKWDNMNFPSAIHPFITCLEDNFLDQLVGEPTRGDNYLDLVLCTDNNIVQNLTVGKPFVKSDHLSVHFYLMIAKDIAKVNVN